MDGSSPIREARRRKGWSQDQLAAAVGVSRSAVAQWETGRAGQLAANLVKLGAALDISSDDLLGSGRTEPLIQDISAPIGKLHDISACSADELALLRLYRSCSPDDQKLILITARRLSRKRAMDEEPS